MGPTCQILFFIFFSFFHFLHGLSSPSRRTMHASAPLRHNDQREVGLGALVPGGTGEQDGAIPVLSSRRPTPSPPLQPPESAPPHDTTTRARSDSEHRSRAAPASGLWPSPRYPRRPTPPSPAAAAGVGIPHDMTTRARLDKEPWSRAAPVSRSACCISVARQESQNPEERSSVWGSWRQRPWLV